MKFQISILSTLFSLQLFAVSTGLKNFEKDPSLITPMFTGPLLGPSAVTVPQGHLVMEPYAYLIAFTGNYDKNWNTISTENFYSLVFQNFIMTGLTPFTEFRIIPQFFHQFTRGVQSTEIGDLPIVFGWQLFDEVPSEWLPSIKLYVRINYPIGKYQRLDPKKLGTDKAGTGSWLPTIGLASSKLFILSNSRFISFRTYFGYTFANSTPVNELNVYGGGLGTQGIVYPGNTIITSVSAEIGLSRNWVFCTDIQYIHKNKTKFFGNPGFIAPGIPATVGSPASEEFSIAPGIEYNWNPNIGIIAGSWLSFAGKNSRCFRSGILAIHLYF